MDDPVFDKDFVGRKLEDSPLVSRWGFVRKQINRCANNDAPADLRPNRSTRIDRLARGFRGRNELCEDVDWRRSPQVALLLLNTKAGAITDRDRCQALRSRLAAVEHHRTECSATMTLREQRPWQETAQPRQLCTGLKRTPSRSCYNPAGSMRNRS